MLKKWALTVMLLAMLAAPMLACGFPLPAGTSMMAVSKAVCAEGETAESCQLRQDAYQLMGKVSAASVNDLAVDLYIDDGTVVTSAVVNGTFDYVVSESSEYLGANVRVLLEDAVVEAEGDVDDLSDTEFLVIDDMGYTRQPGESEWIEEELDPTALLGLSFLLGLSGTQGASLDLFNAPGVFTVTEGAPETLDGQQMIVQTLAVDMGALLGNPEALMALFNDAAGMGLESMGLDMNDLGDPNQIIPVAPMLAPFLEGTQVTATLWIGADDGLIHRIDEYYELQLDLSATDPTMNPMTMRYALSGTITNHNADLMIARPNDVIEGEGGLLGGGLSGGLFGN